MTTNQNSSVAGSPIGHLQVRSVSSINDNFFEFFSSDLTFSSVSALISEDEGCGGSGCPAENITFLLGRTKILSLRLQCRLLY